MKVRIGIDIGGTNTVFGLVNIDGEIIHQGSLKTKSYPDFSKFVDQICKNIDKLITEKIEVEGIGIGAPNGNFFNGTIEFAPNLQWNGILNVVSEFKKHFDCKIVLTNDANAAAMGEKIYGNAKSLSDFLMITLGTGVGSGIYTNNQIVYGHDGFAGEIGHVIAVPNGRTCGCGRKGCLETYASATGIVRTVNELLVNDKENSLRYNENITAYTIYEAAKEGNELALKAFEITAKILGETLANSVAYTSPEKIFLFGGLAKAGDLIFNPTQKYFEENLLNIYKNKIEILPSGLLDKNIAVLGASALVA